MKVRWTARAARQLRDAILFLEEQRTGSGHALHDEIRRVIRLATRHPRLFPRVPGVEGETRRALIRRFGHWLIFEVIGAEIIVLALWHHRRDPGGWQEP